MTQQTITDKVALAIGAALDQETITVAPDDGFIEDLGFDSLKIANLSIALEEQFDDTILLSDWLGTVDNPLDLTVQSLVDYLGEVLEP